MYGLQRGSADWGSRAHKVILSTGAVYIGDHGEGSLYSYTDPKSPSTPPTLIILYSDDFDIAGPHEDYLYDLIAKEVGFDHRAASPESLLEEIIGMEIWGFEEPDF